MFRFLLREDVMGLEERIANEALEHTVLVTKWITDVVIGTKYLLLFFCIGVNFASETISNTQWFSFTDIRTQK